MSYVPEHCLTESTCEGTVISAVTLIYNPQNPKHIDYSKLKVQPTLGAGDCLYHALGQLSNHYRHKNAYKYFKNGAVDVKSLRNAVAVVIDNNWDYFHKAHPELKSIDRDQFLREVKLDRWGGEPEIEAALYLFPDVRIAVWTRDANNDTVLHSLVTSPSEQYKKTWHMLMHANHYEWMSQYSQTAKNVTSVKPQRPHVHPLYQTNLLLRELHEQRQKRTPLKN